MFPYFGSLWPTVRGLGLMTDNIKINSYRHKDEPKWEEIRIQETVADVLSRKLQDIYEEFPDLLQIDMLDLLDVFVHGARKHGTNNYLEAEGTKCSRNDNSASMLRHLGEFASGKQHDKDSHLHPALHLACRAMIGYIRDKRHLKHSRDI